MGDIAACGTVTTFKLYNFGHKLFYHPRELFMLLSLYLSLHEFLIKTKKESYCIILFFTFLIFMRWLELWMLNPKFTLLFKQTCLASGNLFNIMLLIRYSFDSVYFQLRTILLRPEMKRNS